jgi:hypothetical protein
MNTDDGDSISINQQCEAIGAGDGQDDCIDDLDNDNVTGVDTDNITGVESNNENDDTTGVERGNEHEERHYNLRPRKPRSYDFRYDHQYLTYDEPFGLLFMTEQMSMKKGLAKFGKKGADAVVAELRQIHYQKAIEPKHKTELGREEQRRALRYLMYLKEKRCGRIKARGCADGRKQRIYKSKEETRSPTVSTEAVFLTSIVDAQEKRCVVTLDIPGAFMHAYMDEVIHMRLDGVMAELLTRVNPDKYSPYICYEGGNKVIYVQLSKALYGTLQAALLFWKDLSNFLIDNLGFSLNPYN